MLRMMVGETLPGVRLAVPPAATDEDLVRVHTPEYVAAVTNGSLDPAAVRRIGFPWSPELVERSKRSTGASISAARAALRDGAAANLAGGTHHAFPDRGEGFCVFNDVAVAARAVQAEGTVDRVAVVDLDVHQGNGTAAIFRDDASVFTFSVHGENNYPFRKERSDLDIALTDGAGDREFLNAVEEGLEEVRRTAPDLVFYVAGADPFSGDRLGRLTVSKAGLLERDELVVRFCRTSSVPLVVVMSGGYAHDLRDIVEIHLQSVRTVATAAGTFAS